MKIGFTGTQVGMTEAQKARVREILLDRNGNLDSEFHHGDCIGADAEAHDIAQELGLKIIGHPPIETSKRAGKKCDELRPPAPYLDRNRDIVNEVQLLLVTPKEQEESLRSGTWYTYRYAKRVRRPILLILPNGKIAP